ncbi:MAG: TetR/AcrR family transcriptional regulator [Chitinophagaceae bacterium]|nr:TetR/AcrR family transcriptional regulator [Chitinophagaceae bacterium]
MTKKEMVKQKIGAGAMQCFSRYGLEKTTLDDIAKTIGLNKASLYYYYKNKEDIFLEAALNEGQQFIATLQQKVLLKKGVEARVQFYLQERVQYYMHVLNKNKVTTDTLQKILPRFFELYDDVMKEEIKFVTLLIKEGIKAGNIVKTDAEKLSSSLINISDALKHSVEQQALLKGETEADYTLSLQEMKFLVQLIFNGLKK